MTDSIQAYQKALSKGAGRPTKALLTVWEKRIVRKTCVPSAGDRNESKDDGVNERDLDEASQFLIGKILVGSITISVGWVAYTSAHVKASADASLQAALT